jgi:type IV secretory pathway TraG/TraD family ATPase VirD4
MGDLVPVTPRNTLPATNTDGTARRDLPLGTAQWYHLDRNGKPLFRKGDFWLSRSQTGEAVGLADDRHALITSGTRAGKGVSVIVPNLVLWPGSVFVLDPKGENAKVTARRRGAGSRYCWGLGQKVRILDPFGEVRNENDDFSDVRVRFNPIAMLAADNPHSVDDAGRIADALIVSESSNDPFWEDSARMVVKALALHVATSRYLKDEERTLLKLRGWIVAGDTKLRDRIAETVEGKPPSALAVLFKSMTRNPAFGGVIAETGEMLLDC